MKKIMSFTTASPALDFYPKQPLNEKMKRAVNCQKKRGEPSMKIMSFVLALTMLFSVPGVALLHAGAPYELFWTDEVVNETGFAFHYMPAGSTTGDNVATGFVKLPHYVEFQVFYQGTITSKSQVTLPSTLDVYVEHVLRTVGVVWESEEEFDASTTGGFLFTPTLPQGYVWCGYVMMPMITVLIVEPRDFTLQEVVAEGVVQYLEQPGMVGFNVTGINRFPTLGHFQMGGVTFFRGIVEQFTSITPGQITYRIGGLNLTRLTGTLGMVQGTGGGDG